MPCYDKKMSDRNMYYFVYCTFFLFARMDLLSKFNFGNKITILVNGDTLSERYCSYKRKRVNRIALTETTSFSFDCSIKEKYSSGRDST